MNRNEDGQELGWHSFLLLLLCSAAFPDLSGSVRSLFSLDSTRQSLLAFNLSSWVDWLEKEIKKGVQWFYQWELMGDAEGGKLCCSF